MKSVDWLIVAVGALVLYVLWERQRGQGNAIGVNVANPPTGIGPPPGTATGYGVTQSLPSAAVATAPPKSGPTGVAGTVAGVAGLGESAASAYFHVPLATIGNAAIRAPTWAKVLIPSAYPTELAQKFINDPVGSTKAAATTIAHDVAHPIDTAKSAAKAVGSAAKSVGSAAKSVASSIGHAFGSIF